MPPNSLHVKSNAELGFQKRYGSEIRAVILNNSVQNRKQIAASKEVGLSHPFKERPLSQGHCVHAKTEDIHLCNRYFEDYSGSSQRNNNLSAKDILRERIHKLSGLTATRAKLHKHRSFKKEKTHLHSKKPLPHSPVQDTTTSNFFNPRTGTSIRTLFFSRLQIKFRFITTPQGTVRLKMGQTLSEPVTKKESSSDENHSLKVGASCMQGWRINMEDEHVHKLCLNDEKDTHFFAVYDGHGGQAAAQYAAKQLHTVIVNHSAYRQSDIVTACKAGFLAVDENMSKDSLGKDDSSGCTAVAILMKGTKLYCANVGDSRAVASVRGHAQLLSFDHKPNHERESRRINAAGGFVEFNRVNGNLALSRALGDFIFKKNDHRTPEEQIVTADPDVIVKDITKDHEFIVLACDGIWDVMSNKDVVEFVRKRLGEKTDPDVICEELMNKCLATECSVGGVGCDNMTVVIIAFKQNGSFEELCKKCTLPKRDPIPPSCLLSSYPDYVRGGISCL